MKTKTLLFFLFGTFIFTTFLAAVPSTINYQGRLTDSSGVPLANETVAIEISIYDSELSGINLHSEIIGNVVTDDTGYYSFQFGSSIDSTLASNDFLWLELTIDGSPLNPRQQLQAVPYALVAKAAESIVPGSDADAAIYSAIETSRNYTDQQVTDAHGWAIQHTDSSIANLQADVDQNEADADAAIDSIQDQLDASTPIIFVTWELPDIGSRSSIIDDQQYLYNGANFRFVFNNPSQYEPNHVDEGDTFLLTNRGSDNGIYEVLGTTHWGDLYVKRLDNFNESHEFHNVHVVFVKEGDNAGYGYFLNPVAQNFSLDDWYSGNDDLSYSLFTLDLSQGMDVEGMLTAGRLVVDGPGGRIEFDGYNNGITTYDRTTFDGYGEIRFENTGGVIFDYSPLVPSPVSGTEVTNKDYVDALVNTNVTAIENNNQRLHSLESSAPQWGVNETAIENNNQRLHSLESSAPQWGVNETAIENNNQRLYSLESSAPQWGVNETAIANNEQAIEDLQSLVAADPKQMIVDFVITSNTTINSANITTYDWDNDITFSCEIGDKVLLTGQSDSSKNGIYDISNIIHTHSSSKSVSLIRSDNYNSAEEIIEGDVVLVQSGLDAGSLFMLGNLPESFELEVDVLPWHRSGINTLQDVENNNQRLQLLETAAPMWGTNETAIENNNQRLQLLETAAPMWGTNETAISALQTDVDQNESDAEAAILALQSEVSVLQNSSAKSPVQQVFYWHQANLSSLAWWGAEVGDRALLTAQSPSSENGIYEVISKTGNYVALARANDFDSENEINAGVVVFAEDGYMAGQGYILSAIPDNFVLGSNSLTFNRFTIDTSQDVQFEQSVTAREFRSDYSGDVDFRLGPYENSFSLNSPWAEFLFEGYGGTVKFREQIEVEFSNSGGVDFDTEVEFTNTVSVPSPSNSTDATNKDYVDSVTVPVGGMVAWPSSTAVPSGWVNPGNLDAPMPNYIWIRKD